jgi:DnaK suppressor protein
MTEQIDSLKSALESKRSELARAIRSQSAQLNICEGENDVLDRMQSMTRRDEAVTFLHTLTQTLADVNAALAAMQEGSYGTCAECGELIASKRLRAIPWAAHCIRCQEFIDHRNCIGSAITGWGEAA